MNSRSQTFDLEVEGYQVDEAVASIFHSVLLHRSLGKFSYKSEGRYKVGTVGYEDVDCDFIDLTYVCCSSPQLERRLKNEISVFSRALRRDDGPYCRGKISLEFYQRKRAWWPFHSEMTPWEAWDLRIELVQLNTEAERAIFREKLGALLSEKIMRIAQVINRNDYVPKVPDQSDLDLVFDTTYEDVQPYLFQISFVTATPPPPSVGSTVKKILRETLYM
uniref:Autophagy-related protein 101 n=1 Tax=Lygus hesperus TaxID=30085 RepID=A0A0A9YCN0_LYGHE